MADDESGTELLPIAQLRRDGLDPDPWPGAIRTWMHRRPSGRAPLVAVAGLLVLALVVAVSMNPTQEPAPAETAIEYCASNAPGAPIGQQRCIDNHLRTMAP
ncbi:MAG: hypothetical protein R3246_16595 [Acidimicrobiia bacterium]|nr:hypothetical protein [Acidimicrobiia bacterium]